MMSWGMTVPAMNIAGIPQHRVSQPCKYGSVRKFEPGPLPARAPVKSVPFT